MILEEVDGRAGEVLWRVFRSVATWSATSAATTGAAPLGEPVAGWAEMIARHPLPAALAEPLRRLGSALGGTARSGATEAGAALQAIGRWATEAGHRRTGAEFLQLAATVCPADARAALAAGQATRRLADYSRSEVWLQRAVGLARREDDWATYAEGFIELGTMMRRRGSIPAARKHFLRAYRRSVRAGLRELRAHAAHDLFVIDTELGRREDAVAWAREALRYYPAGDENLPRVAFDLAFLWMEDGLFEAALRVFSAVEPLIQGGGNVVVWGGIARAAGGCGDEESFERARRALLQAEPVAGLSDAWLELARGARHLHRGDDASDAARRALALARSRRERKVEMLAEALLSEPVGESKVTAPSDATVSVDQEEIAAEVTHLLQPA